MHDRVAIFATTIAAQQIAALRTEPACRHVGRRLAATSNAAVARGSQHVEQATAHESPCSSNKKVHGAFGFYKGCKRVKCIVPRGQM